MQVFSFDKRGSSEGQNVHPHFASKSCRFSEACEAVDGQLKMPKEDPLILPRFYREIGKGYRIDTLSHSDSYDSTIRKALYRTTQKDTVLELPKYIKEGILPIVTQALLTHRKEIFHKAGRILDGDVYVFDSCPSFHELYASRQYSQSALIQIDGVVDGDLFGSYQNSVDVLDQRSELGIICRVEKIIQRKGHAVVLDLGCGGALALAELKIQFGDKITTIGVALTEEPHLPVDYYFNRAFEYLPKDLADTVDLAFSHCGLDYAFLPDVAVQAAHATLAIDGELCILRDRAFPTALCKCSPDSFIKLYLDHLTELRTQLTGEELKRVERFLDSLTAESTSTQHDLNRVLCSCADDLLTFQIKKYGNNVTILPAKGGWDLEETHYDRWVVIKKGASER